MKKIIPILFIFISFYGNSQSITILDDADGFRNLHFGDNITNYPSMKPFYYTKDSLYISYRKENDSLIFANANVDLIYTFFKGELMTVMIKTDDSLGSRRVLESFHKKYGKGRQQDPYLESYYWYGRKVILEYHEDMNTFKASIYINSIRMKLKSENRDK